MKTHYKETKTADEYRTYINGLAAAQIGPHTSEEDREEAQEWANDCWDARFGPEAMARKVRRAS